MNEHCIFCRIVRGEVPATRVFEDDKVVAIRDVNPQAPSHLLILPRAHTPDLLSLPGTDDTWKALIAAVQQLARDSGFAGGFRLVVNQGRDGGQSVDHLHLHLLGGRVMTWPPG